MREIIEKIESVMNQYKEKRRNGVGSLAYKKTRPALPILMLFLKRGKVWEGSLICISQRYRYSSNIEGNMFLIIEREGSEVIFLSHKISFHELIPIHINI